MSEVTQEPPRAKPIRVTAFIDWNSQIHNARTKAHLPLDAAKRTLQKTAHVISRALSCEHSSGRFDVTLRLYHGWHKGWQKTDGLKAVMQTASDPAFPTHYSTPNVVFRPALHFGHTLLSALSKRMHDSHQFHLGNTLRKRSKTQPEEEKLVDTALAADLLHWARESPTEWALVLAEDDDIVPPIFTAETWIQGHGGRTFIVRVRPADQYLRLDGLLRDWK